MLAFPAPKWNTALLSTTTTSNSFPGIKAGCASLIIPRLYLSDLFTARDEKELKRLGITHIITVLQCEANLPRQSVQSIRTVVTQIRSSCVPEANRLHVPVHDIDDENISAYFENTREFIKAALNENESNKVLVHCFQGVSRSATIVCAYLIATQGMTAIGSIEFAQSKRGIVSPNNGFRKQLATYATHFVGSRSQEGQKMFKLSDSIANRIRHLKSSK